VTLGGVTVSLNPLQLSGPVPVYEQPGGEPWVGVRHTMSRNGDNQGRQISAPDLIRFPALSFSQRLVNVINSLDDLSHCTKLGFKKGYYKHLTLVDSIGKRLEVVGARKVKTLPFRFTFRDLLAVLGANPRWQVELLFAPDISQLTLEEVKNLIYESFRNERHFWEEMSDFEEFQQRVQSADTLEQIFAAFKEFNLT
jgi:hypothetical protein